MSSPLEKRQKSNTMSLSSCFPLLSSPDLPGPKPGPSNRSLVPKATKLLRSIPHPLGPSRPRKCSATSIPRCLLISEILSLVLEFIRRFDESSESDTKLDRNSGKRTLVSLAQTCRAMSDPALDALWMRLDNLDPLIKVLPRRMWSKKHYPFVVRFFMGEKQWMTFRKYAERVKYLRGPCRRVSASVQHNVMDALVRYPRATFPLLPNLNELVWSELKMTNLIDSCVYLIKYFAGPAVTTISLSLLCWPHVSSELAVLADLPNLCPNVTSFSAFFPRSSYRDYSAEIGEIVRRWPHLHVLRSCALSQPVMDTITSGQALDTLSIELNNSSPALYVGQLPSHVHTLSLGGNSALLCQWYLKTMQGSPTNFHLRIGADNSTTSNVDELVGMLPMRLDRDRLRTLTIELTSSYWSTPASDSFSLLPTLRSSLASFSALKELDLSTFCAAEVDDQEYEAWIAGLRGLTSLKVGVADVSKARPMATVGAVLAVLRTCRQLKTLWMVFDASLQVPSGLDDKGKRLGELKIDEDKNEWGVTNHYITDLHVGCSPIADNEEGRASLARCFRTVMPRLKRIRVGRYASAMDAMDAIERWGKVQRMLVLR